MDAAWLGVDVTVSDEVCVIVVDGTWLPVGDKLGDCDGVDSALGVSVED